MIYKLIPPTDVRVNSAIAPFTDEALKEHNIKDRKELADNMFETMVKYGGIGLTCNQVGLPYNMFVLGGHPQIENGAKMACFNPKIIEQSKETIRLKEGCLTFPFIFLDIERPKAVKVEYENEQGEKVERMLEGYMSRIYQHEYDHVLGRNFTERASKFKLERAREKARKLIKTRRKLAQAT